MEVCKSLGAIFLCVIFACLIKAQVEEGTPCETPTKQYGLCIRVKSCQVVLDLLNSGVTPELKSFLRSFSCGFNNNIALVCCPQPNTRNPVINGVTGDADNISSNENNPNSVEFQVGETLLTPPDCGFSNVSNPKVVGGIPAQLGEFPWIVALGYRNPKNPSFPKWLCGGSLITHKHVLTAGHCVYNRSTLYLARVGELDLYDDNDGAHPVDILIQKVKVHENYSGTEYTNDIAILTLSEATTNIPGVWPICLPWEAKLRSKNFLNYRPFVAGWGSIYYNGPTSSYLQLTTIPVVNNDLCKKAYENSSIVDERIICAGYANGGKDACKGDSGGPLMYGMTERRNIRFFQIGVVSYGFRCAEAGYPGVYTRVTHFINWIQNNLN